MRKSYGLTWCHSVGNQCSILGDSEQTKFLNYGKESKGYHSQGGNIVLQQYTAGYLWGSINWRLIYWSNYQIPESISSKEIICGTQEATGMVQV